MLATSPYLNRPLRPLAEARATLLRRAAADLHRAIEAERWTRAAWHLTAAAETLREAGERALADRAAELGEGWPCADAVIYALLRRVDDVGPGR